GVVFLQPDGSWVGRRQHHHARELLAQQWRNLARDTVRCRRHDRSRAGHAGTARPRPGGHRPGASSPQLTPAKANDLATKPRSAGLRFFTPREWTSVLTRPKPPFILPDFAWGHSSAGR